MTPLLKEPFCWRNAWAAPREESQTKHSYTKCHDGIMPKSHNGCNNRFELIPSSPGQKPFQTCDNVLLALVQRGEVEWFVYIINKHWIAKNVNWISKTILSSSKYGIFAISSVRLLFSKGMSWYPASSGPVIERLLNQSLRDCSILSRGCRYNISVYSVSILGGSYL